MSAGVYGLDINRHEDKWIQLFIQQLFFWRRVALAEEFFSTLASDILCIPLSPHFFSFENYHLYQIKWTLLFWKDFHILNIPLISQFLMFRYS